MSESRQKKKKKKGKIWGSAGTHISQEQAEYSEVNINETVVFWPILSFTWRNLVVKTLPYFSEIYEDHF